MLRTTFDVGQFFKTHNLTRSLELAQSGNSPFLKYCFAKRSPSHRYNSSYSSRKWIVSVWKKMGLLGRLVSFCDAFLAGAMSSSGVYRSDEPVLKTTLLVARGACNKPLFQRSLELLLLWQFQTQNSWFIQYAFLGECFTNLHNARLKTDQNRICLECTTSCLKEQLKCGVPPLVCSPSWLLACSPNGRPRVYCLSLGIYYVSHKSRLACQGWPSFMDVPMKMESEGIRLLSGIHHLTGITHGTAKNGVFFPQIRRPFVI